MPLAVEQQEGRREERMNTGDSYLITPGDAMDLC
jgi:hypothetical protein